MYTDEFEVRLARVRHRFATTLDSKIADAVVLADRMAHSDDDGPRLVADSYRLLHNMCGIGPTVGFAATGEAARVAESTLLQAFHQKCLPAESEIDRLKKALGQLRKAAASELLMMYQRGG
jgi:hypothetical protein